MKKKYPFLNELNDSQYEGAITTEGPVLILAGAGSGKTKTIIARTAYIISEKKCYPNEILIMTFTNKAAKEMKERGDLLLNDMGIENHTQPNFTTFHSWGAKFLRSGEVGEEMLLRNKLNRKFTIMDTTSQVSIFNKLKHKYFDKETAKKIKHAKILLPMGSIQNHLVPYESFGEAYPLVESLISNYEVDFGDAFPDIEMDKTIISGITQMYVSYKRELRNNNCVDFEDLIGMPIKIISENEQLRSIIKNRFKYVMADEFQDTNKSQLTLMHLLVGESDNICVVGDNDQSIYGWRGAEIKYILGFQDIFENTKIINLKLNYRSHKKIVEKANKLLESSNQQHDSKEELVAHSSKDGVVKARFFKKVASEAKFIVNTIRELGNRGISFGEMSVLYRAGRLKREVEIELINSQIPYRIHRGKTLLEKSVSVDVMNYFKYLDNEKNEMALSRILIGGKILTEKRVAELHNDAEGMGEGFFEYLKTGGYDNIPRLGAKTKDKIVSFVEEIEMIRNSLKNEDYADFIDTFFSENCIMGCYQDVVDARVNSREVSEAAFDTAISYLNIIDIIKDLSLKFKNLEEFLEVTSLDGEGAEKDEEKVNLMTIHSSKGLEFDIVFVMGLTMGIFPGTKIGTDIEEERRLAYVAMTRARKYLSLTGAVGYYGPDRNARPSMFIQEAGIPIEYE